MGFYRGGTLLLDSGRRSISTGDVRFCPKVNYGENEEFIRLFVLTYVKLLCDSPLRTTDGDKPLRLYLSFLDMLCKNHVRETIRRFSGLSHELLSSQYVTGDDTTTGVFIDAMKDTPVFKEYLTWHRTRRPDLLKYLVTFLTFGKKLEYEDEELNAAALRSWWQVEDRLRALTFRSEDIGSLANIIAILLPPLKVDHLLPSFGPGKVAERGVRDVYGKLDNLSLHARMAYAFNRSRPGRSLDEGFANLRVANTQSVSERSASRYKDVRKDATKSRSICMEPNVFMYFQQEVMRWMVQHMDSGPIGQFVTLRDQRRSREAAVHGSKYLCTDTIDLSSASDSVSVDLVKRVFPKDWLFYLLATRSSTVELPGDIGMVKVLKFAPMGSAVCFPVQCILFTAICVYAGLLHEAGLSEAGSRTFSQGDVRDYIKHRYFASRSDKTPFSLWKFEPPVVYGDDIACDSRHTVHVTSILQRLGFQVNITKSFTGAQSFRESCGVFAFEGEDITPTLFRLPLMKRGRLDAKQFASLIGAINQFRAGGYHSVATFLLTVLNDCGLKYPVPFTEDTDGWGIYTVSKKPVNPAHLRWNADWQIQEELIQGIGPIRTKKIEPNNLESYRYDQWWRARTRGYVPPEQSERLRVRPEETRLVPTWAGYYK